MPVHYALLARRSILKAARRAPRTHRQRWAFWRGAGLPGVEVLTTQRSPMLARFYTERPGVGFCHQGASGGPAARSRQFGCEQGLPVRLMQPGEVNVDRCACRCPGIRMIFLDPTLITALASERGMSGSLRFRSADSRDPRLLGALADLGAAVDQGGSGAEVRACISECTQHVLDLMSIPPAPARDLPHPVGRARDWLHHHFNESITLDQLAEVAQLSPYHLLRVFRRAIGLPPHTYQIRLRIERARRMLQTGVPPTLVAPAVGFADQSHFTRHFRRVLGITPGAYQTAGTLAAAR